MPKQSIQAVCDWFMVDKTLYGHNNIDVNKFSRNSSMSTNFSKYYDVFDFMMLNFQLELSSMELSNWKPKVFFSELLFS